MASLLNSFRLLNMFLEDDSLSVLILIAFGIYLTMGAGWLELTLMYADITLVLLNGL